MPRARVFVFVAAALLIVWWLARAYLGIGAPGTFEVQAAMGWQDTGVVVRSGDTLAIEYVSGEWSPWPGGQYGARGSGGDPYCDCNVLKGVSHASLVGRVGGGDPFFVGETFRTRVPDTGPLFLSINDNILGDNSGEITVDITAGR